MLLLLQSHLLDVYTGEDLDVLIRSEYFLQNLQWQQGKESKLQVVCIVVVTVPRMVNIFVIYKDWN